MPSVMVDTSYPHSDRALKLCRMLNEPMADALPMRLWCWGLDTDRKHGRFSADAKQLAQIVRFSGNPEKLLEAFLACDVIENTENEGEFRIKGWGVNRRFFKERDRLRRMRETHKKTRAKRVQDANKTEHSSSSSSSIINTERGDPSAPWTIAEAKRLLVPASEAQGLYEHWRQEQLRIRNQAMPLIAPSAALEGARAMLIVMTPEQARLVVTAFVQDAHPYWVQQVHRLSLMANPRDLEQAMNLVGSKPKAVSMADKVAEEKRRLAERQRAEENGEVA